MVDAVFKAELESILNDVADMTDGNVKLTPQGSVIFAWFVRWGATLGQLTNEFEIAERELREHESMDGVMNDTIDKLTVSLEGEEEKLKKSAAGHRKSMDGSMRYSNALMQINMIDVDPRNKTATKLQQIAKEAINANRNSDN